MARRPIPFPPGWPGFALAVGLATVCFVVGPLTMVFPSNGDPAAAPPTATAAAFACAAAACGAVSTVGIAMLFVPHASDPPLARPSWAMRASTRRGGLWARFLVPAGLALLGLVAIAWSTWFVTTTGTAPTSVAAQGTTRGGTVVEHPVWAVQVSAGLATLGAAVVAAVHWPLRRRWRREPSVAPDSGARSAGRPR